MMSMEKPIWWEYAIFDEDGLTDQLQEEAHEKANGKYNYQIAILERGKL